MNLPWLRILTSMMIGPGNSGSSSVRGSFDSVALFLGRPSLVCFLRETRIVLFLVCPSLDFPPPRRSGNPTIILCVLPTRSEGRSVNCSILFLNLSWLMLTPLSYVYSCGYVCVDVRGRCVGVRFTAVVVMWTCFMCVIVCCMSSIRDNRWCVCFVHMRGCLGRDPLTRRCWRWRLGNLVGSLSQLRDLLS